jgi:hypothetical protein
MACAPVVWVMLAEIPLLPIQGLAIGVAVCALWIENVIIGLFFPVVVDVFGVASTFFLIVGLGAIAMAFVYYCVPETKGRSLEQIEAYFRVRFAKEAN